MTKGRTWQTPDETATPPEAEPKPDEPARPAAADNQPPKPPGAAEPRWATIGRLYGRLPRHRARVQQTIQRLHQWANRWGPPGHITWSTGKDSTVAAHLTRSIWPDTPLVTFDSGLEFPETLPFGDHICELLNWDNWTVIAANPTALEWMTAARTWDHTTPIGEVPCTLHETLIEAPSRLAQTLHPGPTIRGLRAQESPQRQALLASTQGAWQNNQGHVTWEPIWDWTLEDIWAYHATHNLPRSPAYDRLESIGCPPEQQRVSLMIEGHAVTTGRLTWLKRGWPNEWAQLTQQLPTLKAFS